MSSIKNDGSCLQPQAKLPPRGAFTLIEMTVVSVLLAVAAAIVLPKWQQSLERTKVAGMQRAVETDIAYLCRHSVRRGQTTTVTLTTGTSTLQISPPLPNVLGDGSGLVNYADRFPGVAISQADFDGFNKFRINQFGELIRDSDGARLSVGRVTFNGGTTSKITDVLVAHGTLSPLPPPPPPSPPPPPPPLLPWGDDDD